MILRNIVCFGDSLTAGYVPMLASIAKHISLDVCADIINAGIGGETSRDGVLRSSSIHASNPQVVIVGFGMNDQQRGISEDEYEHNLSQIADILNVNGVSVLFLTITPVKGCANSFVNRRIQKYNQIVKDVAHEKCLRFIDVASAWKREFGASGAGLKDSVHPNCKGNKLYADTIVSVLRRPRTIILWQYNGNPCACNYACPYCTYDPRKQAGNHFVGTIEGWHKAFRDTFGNQRITLYLAHGEPMLGKKFYDVLDMVGDEKDWAVRMTTNLSMPLNKLVQSKVAKEGRMNVNASFHPTEVSRDKFLRQAMFLREHGIEVPIVYVMYPPLIERFEEDFECFNSENFLVHVRRFGGIYESRVYPQAYTDEQRQFIAKYSDDAAIKYMLNMEPSYGKASWTGVDFILINNKGDVGHCDDYPSGSFNMGNIFSGTFRMKSLPQPFLGKNISDGTVDGVANFVELDYPQLNGNNVITFAGAGGVNYGQGAVRYKNIDTDFTDSSIRAQYGFPSRNLNDSLQILVRHNGSLSKVFRDAFSYLVPKFITRLNLYIWVRIKWRLDALRIKVNH